jgi:iron complex transport system substrate-binding protein
VKKKKMKTKIVVLIGLALCTMLLISPALASDTSTLEIYGNANEDDTIDMRDLTYVKLIFFGKKPETELADAKYDGKINPLDFIQIKLIIVGKEKELTVVDSIDRIVTVRKPVERIISPDHAITAAIKSIGAEDKVVGVNTEVKEEEIFFPELSKLPAVCGCFNPDYEAIIALEADIVIQNYWCAPEEIGETLEPAGIPVACLNLFMPTTLAEEVKKLGYILGKKDRADEFINWYEGYLDTIAERVEGLSEDDKPRVFGYYGGEYGHGEGPPYGTFGKDNDAGNTMIEMAGGINIAGDLPGDWITVEAEWVTWENPSVIFREAHMGTIVGYEIDDTSEAAAMREDIISQPAFTPTDAVKEENIYIISKNVMDHGEFFLGVQYMAKWFHPTLFEDMDPKATHQEYLTRFQRIDYDLDEHGVFVYPLL